MKLNWKFWRRHGTSAALPGGGTSKMLTAESLANDSAIPPRGIGFPQSAITARSDRLVKIFAPVSYTKSRNCR